MKNKIAYINFDYENQEVIIHFKKKLPSTAYGHKELRKFLKKWGNENKRPQKTDQSN